MVTVRSCRVSNQMTWLLSRLRAIIVMLFASAGVYAQCPVIDFSVAASVCKNTELAPQAAVTNAVSYSWDFCDGSVANTPASIISQSNGLITEPYDLQSYEENGMHYLLSVNYNNGKVLRYSFGSSYANAPSITDLGNFGVISRPLGIGLWQESNVVYALVTTEGGTLHRLTFGSSISNTPTIAPVTGVTGLNDHRHIKITKDNGAVIALATGGSLRVLSVLNFGSSILNTPTRTFISIPDAAHMIGLDIAVECNNRYAIVSGYTSGLFKVDFGTSFLNTPTVTPISSISETSVWGLSLIKSAGNYHAFIFSDASGVSRIDFGNSLANATPTKTVLGFFSGLNLTIGFTLAHTGSTYFCASVNYTNGLLNVLQFPKSCTTTNTFLNEANPEGVSYTTTGVHQITLSAKGSNDELVTVTKSITVSSLTAPSLIINESGNCQASAVTFTGLQQNGDPLNTLSWDFGDGNTATGQNPSNLFAIAGTYDVLLEATAADGCFNRLKKAVPIYNAPVADFDLPPASPFCSNQNYLFPNTSNVDSGYPTNWEWRVNGLVVSSAEDLNYTFTNTANQEIKLNASIPGCESEKIENISSLIAGPSPDFSFVGHCENANVVFTNTSTGTIDGYDWDFGDGQNAAVEDPAHIFSDYGTFHVQLTVSNASGCNNSTTKPVIIYSQPQVNFAAALPPFSCNGTPTQFNDLTPGPPDSNIASWQWDFGDPSSGQNTSGLKNPQHTYALANNYTVSLTVSTNFLCSATLQQPVTISQTPVVDFTHSALCEDSPVNFSGTSPIAIQSWSWMIGGISYSGQNPSHTFSNPGNSNASVMGTASNNCIGSTNKTLTISPKLTPDFSFTRNCVNQQTTFTDVTNAAVDPILTQNWNFVGLGNANGSPVNFTFSDEGNQPVTLTVETQSGCSYAITKSVTILPSPRANFTAVPLVNDPLTIHYTNQSTNATSFLWAFHDSNNTTSTQVSPQFTYPGFGEYQTDLTASNSQECFHLISQQISVVLPVLDVALNGMELIETGPDSFTPMVTIFNNGNVPVSNFNLIMDASGSLFQELVTQTILPGSSYRYTLALQVTDASQLKYVCLEADVEDISWSDNKTCMNLGESLTVFPPYPNPARENLYVDWISKQDGEVRMSLINGLGQEVRNITAGYGEGLSPVIFDIRNLESGPYYLRVQLNGFIKTYKVVVLE